MFGGDNREVCIAVIEAIPKILSSRHLKTCLKAIEIEKLNNKKRPIILRLILSPVFFLFFFMVADSHHPRLACCNWLDMIEELVPELESQNEFVCITSSYIYI